MTGRTELRFQAGVTAHRGQPPRRRRIARARQRFLACVFVVEVELAAVSG